MPTLSRHPMLPRSGHSFLREPFALDAAGQLRRESERADGREAVASGAPRPFACLVHQPVSRNRHAVGDMPTDFLNARLNAASDS